MTLPDREKVIKGLLCCAHTDGINCVYCPYDNTDEDCTALMSMDVLNLLKKQEAKPIVYKENRMTGLPVAICPNCGRFARQFHTEHPGEETNFCPWCGQAVKWE